MDDILKEFNEILGNVKSYINYQKMCGVDVCPRESIVDRSDEPERQIDMGERLTNEIDNIQRETEEIVPPKSAKNSGDISGLMKELESCTRCKLAEQRTKIVFGEGNLDAKLVFVGEAPGGEEDKTGRPFVGRAGKLLTKIINAMGLEREDVYIMNIVKCRPPENRNPQPDEIKTCEPFMLKQLALINPKIICTLGTFSSQTLLRSSVPISKLRGQFHDYHNIKLMPTYHPAYLLRSPTKKRDVWEDMQMIMKEYER